jgi:PAS domain S-box-containing protein
MTKREDAMRKNSITSPNAIELRRQVEKTFREKTDQSPDNLEALSLEEIQRMLHELRVHQIELEMQNEELRLAYVELDTARARYFDLYDLAPVGYCTVSETGLILEANLTATALLGVTRRALIKQPLTRFILKEDQNIFYKHHKKIIETGELQSCEVRMVKNDNMPFWAHLESTVAQDGSGEITDHHGAYDRRKTSRPVVRIMLNDISERKRVESELRESETKLKKAQHYALLGSWTWNIKTNHLDWSDEMFHVFGLERETFTGSLESVITQAIHPDDRPMVEQSNLSVSQHQQPIPLEYRVIWPDQSVHVIWAEAGELLLDQAGQPALLSGTAQDITERKHAEENLRQRLTELESLRIVDRAITTSFDLHFMLNIVLEQTMKQLKVDAVAILLYQPHLHSLEYLVRRGFHTRHMENIHLQLGESFAGRAALEHRIIQVDGKTAMQDNSKIAALWESEGFVSYFAVPLIVQSETNGVLEVFHRTPLDINSGWFDFLNNLADQAAIAIANVQLFESLQRANMDLGLAYDATIEGWSRAMDLRDHETEGHTLRVTELTMHLARNFGKDEAELVHIQRGALLHDIGKIGVPDSILLKAGKLTDEEWVLMRKHPQLAHDMLAPIAYLKDALDIPYCHHEKWDGTGYPMGLKEDQIPQAARIFAIVDVWDALTSDRPYRLAWPKEKALTYITEQSGKHFDPQVVEAFLKNIG